MRLLYVIFVILVILVALLIVCTKKGSKYGRRHWGGFFDGGAGDDFEEYGGDLDDALDADEGYVGGGDFRLKVRDPWYEAMLEGKKKVEGRLDRRPFDRLKKGDPVLVVRSRPQGDTSEFAGGAYKYSTEVVRVTKYPNYAALVKAEGAEKLYPGKKTAEAAVEEFKKFHSAASDLEAPVLAIELKAPTKT